MGTGRWARCFVRIFSQLLSPDGTGGVARHRCISGGRGGGIQRREFRV
jgi:hypothetical protein